MTEKLRPHIGAMINQEEEAQKSLLHCEEKSILCKCQSELLQTPHKSWICDEMVMVGEIIKMMSMYL